VGNLTIAWDCFPVGKIKGRSFGRMESILKSDKELYQVEGGRGPEHRLINLISSQMRKEILNLI